MEKALLLVRLKDSGCRITRTRRAALEVLTGSRVLLSADDLRQALAGSGLKVNKTTVYRELSFLKGRGILHEIHFGDGTVRYRICPDTHHHHVICLNCKRAEAVALGGALEELEAEIGRSKGFRVLHHSLEFFGLCPDCCRTDGTEGPPDEPAADGRERTGSESKADKREE
jgi:Fe2+ or Zn2+ uptake regulation protein